MVKKKTAVEGFVVSEEIYSSSDDSWLLEECILRENLSGKKCLDLGCGSGIQSIAMFKAGAQEVLAADLNASALKDAQKNVALGLTLLKKLKGGKSKTQKLGQGFRFVMVESDLFANVKDKFDFVAFNPPYVPTWGVKWVDLDGGKNGRRVINRFVENVGAHLNRRGVVLLLVSSLNNEKEVAELLHSKGFEVKVIAQKKMFFEEIFVVRGMKK